MYMCSPDRMPALPMRRRGGFTLIEMLLFVIIVGVAFAGLVSVLASSMKGGADTVSQKQALAIAEAIVEEIALKPFTWCDPDDPAAAAATSGGDCTTPEVDGPEAGETRATFDNVNDYIGYTFPVGPITDQSGTYNFPSGFSVSNLTVTAEALGTVPNTASLRISVTVDGPGSSSVTLDTYRTRYAPNFVD